MWLKLCAVGYPTGRAWAFVRDFAAAWAEPLADGAGRRAEELERAEQMPGLTLPAALREVYFLGYVAFSHWMPTRPTGAALA